jgi:hydroxyethylthiazole kinase-like uncharacterized protein yjeF
VSPGRELVRVVSAAEAAARDRAAIDSGIPSRALMQRAGAVSAAEIALRFGPALRHGALVFAGPGNNGGDAWVVARALAASGVRVRVCEPVPAATDDARAERELALPHVELVEADAAALSAGDVYRGEGIVIDGLLGTGSAGTPRGPVGAAVTGIRTMRERATVVALDVPSGVDATSGVVHAPVRAALTLTYGTLKRGHLIARAACGRIAVLDIGLGSFAGIEDGAPSLVTGSWVARHVPEVPADAHKGTRRKIAIVGGAAGMSGAAILAARAAWRSGVGMVKLLVAGGSLAAVREAEPTALTGSWPRNAAEARRELGWADAVAIGPGLGVGTAARETLELVLGEFDGPVVLDADAINAFASDVNGLARHIMQRTAVLTPHPMEFARLTGIAVDDVLTRRFDVGQVLAQHTRAVVLLKGQPTIVTAPTGERLVSASGTPLLAAAGSGDLLTGVVATLLAQVGDPLIAAACAAWVHGRAARLAQRGQSSVRGLTLDHVLERMPDAWRVTEAPTRYPVLLELPDLVPSRAT